MHLFDYDNTPKNTIDPNLLGKVVAFTLYGNPKPKRGVLRYIGRATVNIENNTYERKKIQSIKALK